MEETGTLYVVATPVGNLEDITARAVRVLREVEQIAAEDTRSAGHLLRHLGIRKALISCGAHNESRRVGPILEMLGRGKRVALITESGTPGVSDPGERIVRAARERGFRVVPVPGPCAAVAALSAAGLPTHRFCFIGFPPRGAADFRTALEPFRRVPATLILYESPRRVVETLRALQDVLGDRPAVLARELTKIHEEIVGGTLGSLADALGRRSEIKGEVILLVGGAPSIPSSPAVDAHALLRTLTRRGMSKREAVRTVRELTGHSHRELYRQSLDEA